MSRALLALPGQGAYAAASLGSLPTDQPLVTQVDEWRRREGLLPLSELDAADRLEPGIHLAASNAWPLVWLVSLLEAESAGAHHEVVVTVGNSLGWYTALTAAGVLSAEHGFRLVQTIAHLHQRATEGGGGQLIYPLAGADWQADEELAGHVAAALDSDNGARAYTSIELGAYVVLAGSEQAMERLIERLPEVTVGGRRFPRRLAMHGPQHTPLMSEVAEEARRRLDDLEYHPPRMPLVDGLGRRFSPWSTDPAELATYTLGEQLTTPYRFATSLRVALREYAPESVLLAGPGSTLGAICGQIIVSEGYRGITSRAELEELQRGQAPLLATVPRPS